MMKWGLVIAGLGDLSRPADKLSVSQNSALAITGFIWVRYVRARQPHADTATASISPL